MSDSKKKHNIAKTKGYLKSLYHKLVRRVTKQGIRSININRLDELEIRNPRSIINDWDYIDYYSVCDGSDGPECTCMELFGRPKCISK